MYSHTPVIKGVIHVQILSSETDFCFGITGIQQIIPPDRDGSFLMGKGPLGGSFQVKQRLDIERALYGSRLIQAVQFERHMFSDLECIVEPGNKYPLLPVKGNIKIIITTLVHPHSQSIVFCPIPRTSRKRNIGHHTVLPHVIPVLHFVNQSQPIGRLIRRLRKVIV